MACIPDVDERDHTYNLVWDPTKRMFMTALFLKDNDNAIAFPTKLDKYPDPYTLLHDDSELATKLIDNSTCTVTLFLYYWDNVVRELVEKGRLSGCAVGPRHVITVANFPEKAIPQSVLVVKDNSAPRGIVYSQSSKGSVILPSTWRCVAVSWFLLKFTTFCSEFSPILVELEKPFFSQWLKPSLRPLSAKQCIFTIGYNSVPQKDDMESHYKALETSSTNDPFLSACPIVSPTPELAVELVHPYRKSISPGTVVGLPPSGMVYVSATVTSGSSGGPGFTLPIAERCFDALIQGGKHDMNANIVIPATYPEFVTGWNELSKKLS